MIEPFCSVYTKSYRTYDREPEIEKTKPCLYYDDLEKNFLPAEDSKTIYNPERDEALVKELYAKRLRSTYQVSYCFPTEKKSLVIDPNDLDADQFMVYFNNYYGEKTSPVLRPVDTFRRINGYCRFKHFYTGKSMYEETIGREAYNYFKRDYDLGKSRLFGKKQQAMKKLQNIEETKEENIKDKKEIVNGEKNEAVEEAKCNANDEILKEKFCLFCCRKFGSFCTAKPENPIKNEDQK